MVRLMLVKDRINGARTEALRCLDSVPLGKSPEVRVKRKAVMVSG